MCGVIAAPTNRATNFCLQLCCANCAHWGNCAVPTMLCQLCCVATAVVLLRSNSPWCLRTMNLLHAGRSRKGTASGDVCISGRRIFRAHPAHCRTRVDRSASRPLDNLCCANCAVLANRASNFCVQCVASLLLQLIEATMFVSNVSRHCCPS